MSSFSCWVVQSLRVIGHTLVPHKNSTWLVSNATLEVLSLRNMIEQELQDAIGFFFIITDFNKSANGPAHMSDCRLTNTFCVDRVDI